MSGGHAVLSPSSSHKWLRCVGAPAMEGEALVVKNKDTYNFADEGTAAHFLGAWCLQTGSPPSELIGQTIYVASDTCGFETPLTSPYSKFNIDADMAGTVNLYVRSIREYAQEKPFDVETSVSVEFMTGEKGAKGTIDVRIVFDDELQIHDLKYGRGVEVFAKDNDQLMMYAAASVEELKLVYDFKQV